MGDRAAIGALAGLLVAPMIGITPEIGHLILNGLVAAVIGGFTSLAAPSSAGCCRVCSRPSPACSSAARSRTWCRSRILMLLLYVPQACSERAVSAWPKRKSRLAHTMAPGQHPSSPCVALSLLLALLALAVGSYPIYLLELAMINVIVAIGLNLLTGNCGQISLCHSSFMAIGAYISALLDPRSACRSGSRSRSVPRWLR